MYDTIEHISNSKIQHGPQNDRIYLMHLAKVDLPEIVDVLESLAKKYRYSKIFVKVPDPLSQTFLNNGYMTEVIVPGLYHGQEDGLFMKHYLNKDRSVPIDQAANQAVLEAALAKHSECSEQVKLSDDFTCRIAKPFDTLLMAKLYEEVFDSYPFPIADPNYLKDTMSSDVVYFGIWRGAELVALSSCEMYPPDECVEMTDFAVLPAYRGYGFSYYLLQQMEKTMNEYGLKTAYTIARATSYGMNITFSRSGYQYCGLLPQNTQIGGQIEDMNVWFKSL
jgi:putative beta-lysine N-acetyltransferase